MMAEAAPAVDLAGGLLGWLSDRREEMTEHLLRLVEAESPSLEPDSQGAVFDLLAAPLEEIGYTVRHLPGRTSGGCLYARPHRRSAGRGKQLLLGHSDTVWPRGTLRQMPAVVAGRRLRGPGSYDMKGGLLLAVWALKALRAAAVEPPLVPLLLVNSDEEIGSLDSLRHIRRLARRAERVLVLEPALGPDGRLKTARKGVGQFEVVVRGRAAHAGLEPEKGASAILELSHVVQSLFALNDPERGTTVNVGKIDGGMRTNVVAPESRALVDVRVRTREEGVRIEAEIKALTATTPGTRLEIRGRIGRPPLERTPGNQALWRLARKAGRRLGLSLREIEAGGASDGNFTSLLAPTLDGLGPVGAGAHARNEHVRLDRLPERGALLALLLATPPE